MLSCILGGNRINCFDSIYSKEQLKKWAKKDILLCPVCKKPYEYCHGKVKIPYFRHKDKVKCEDKYSEAETEEHLKGKQDLYEWLSYQDGVTDVVLEGWVSETKQRPDIMFNYKNKKCVIEYQCTPISTEYHERHDLYQAAGINDIWICGTFKYFQFYHKGTGLKRISEIEEKAKIYYDSENKCIYTVDNSMLENTYLDIINNKTYVRNMRNPYDYRINKVNYYEIKNAIKSYDSFSYYPSPTGRPSNKYPYPVTDYKYNCNKSLAKCVKLKNLKLKNIK